MGVGGYRYKYKGFYKKCILPKFTNKERTTIKRVSIGAQWKILPFSFLPLMMINVLEEIRSSRDCVDTTRGSML